jgi:site-specific DNA-cytosine methylase
VKALHLFAGIGGGALGFQAAGFDTVGAIDSDAGACADFELLTGTPATHADLEYMTPKRLAASCSARPDVVFTSPPCKGFSGCLPSKSAGLEQYQRMNALTLRGIWLALEAWDVPPPLVLLENVPRIQTRGVEWLERIEALLRGYGYAVARSTHDCGELGGLAQHRRRFLLVARHIEQVPSFLHVPQTKRVRGIGEVLGELPVPVPGSSEGGPMHRLPKLAAINWVRLALIPAGGDWRDLPPEVRLTDRAARQNGGFGVQVFDEPARAVLGHHDVRSTWGSVADPRVVCTRREGGHGVKVWSDASAPIIGHASIDNGPWQIADPRLGCQPHPGVHGVLGWAQASHTIRGHHSVGNSTAAVADPRVPELVGEPFDIASKRPIHLVIRAADGTWHRPMTTLELAALQGFPLQREGEWLVLTGTSSSKWRERIGNAVPPPAAEAIARSCAATLAAARAGGFMLDPGAIWVRRETARWRDAG